MHNTIRVHPSELPFPFAKATEVAGILYLSGQVAMSAEGVPLHGSVTQQVQAIMRQLEATLASLGTALDRVFKVTVWLSSMAHFGEFNAEYAKWFSHGYPARSVVSCALAFDLDVEIEVQALAAH